MNQTKLPLEKLRDLARKSLQINELLEKSDEKIEADQLKAFLFKKSQIDEIPSEFRDRFVSIVSLQVQFFLAVRRFDHAQDIGDDASMNAEIDEIERLQGAIKKLNDFISFPRSAEELYKAKDFDQFTEILPFVELNELYGSGFGKVSPFPLVWALSARQKPLERVQLMLAAGAKTDLTLKTGETVLHAMAAMKRKSAVRLPILRLLVFKGADLSARTIHGETPLTIAASVGSLEDMTSFLLVGSKVEAQDIRVASSNPQKIEALIEHLANVEGGLSLAVAQCSWLRGEIASTRSHMKDAVRQGAKGEWHQNEIDKCCASLKMLEQLQGSKTIRDSQKFDWQDEPAAFWSVKQAETLGEYREALEQVDIRSFYMPGDHPIYWPIIASRNRQEKMWLMLSAGASVTGTNNGTALHIYAENSVKNDLEQYQIAKMLVQFGSDLEAVNYNGDTPLVIAVGQGGLSEVKALLRLGASPNCICKRHRLYGTPYTAPLIFYAAFKSKIFKHLIVAGAKLSGKTDRGETLMDFMIHERARLEEELDRDMSKNAASHVKRELNNLNRSLKALQMHK